MGKKTLVMGASEHAHRYSYLATNSLLKRGHEVVAIGKQTGSINGVTIETEKKPFENIDTVTMYLNPKNQEQYYNYILSLEPKRVIFNPGAENEEFEKMLESKGIKTQEACTLVLLSTGQF
jgi:predicted CoA-binding protein